MASPSESTSRLPALVFVRRQQCGASRKMESLVAWIKVTHKRRLRVVDLDADRHPEVARRLRVRTTPSLLLMTGGRVVGRLEGRSTGSEIVDLIDRHVRHDRGGSRSRRGRSA